MWSTVVLPAVNLPRFPPRREGDVESPGTQDVPGGTRFVPPISVRRDDAITFNGRPIENLPPGPHRPSPCQRRPPTLVGQGRDREAPRGPLRAAASHRPSRHVPRRGTRSPVPADGRARRAVPG